MKGGVYRMLTFGRFLSVKAFNGNFGLFVGYFCRCGCGGLLLRTDKKDLPQLLVLESGKYKA